ncbi:MAG: TetR/AcrR family transcriptional regulator [Acidimicrobiales bacterium]
MLENASPSSRNLGGRPPEFDRDAVLAAAVFAFWKTGFKATTVGDLETATGVDRSTLYKSFGGKNGLYQSAADTYIAMASEQLFSALHDGTHGVEDILDFINRLATSYLAGQPRGCFIVNDMGTVDEFEATTRYVEILQTGFSAALQRAASTGQIPHDTVKPRCQFLTAAFIGINLAHRNMTDPEIAHNLMDGVRDEVAGWAAADPLWA